MCKEGQQMKKYLFYFYTLTLIIFLTGCSSKDNDGFFYNTFTKNMDMFLSNINVYVKNWGISIIIITLIVKGIILPFMLKNYKKQRTSSINMEKAKPELDLVQNKIKKLSEDQKRALNNDERMKIRIEQTELQKELFKIYKKYDCSPAIFGNLIPILIQAPFISGLYFTLQNPIYSKDILDSSFLSISLGEKSYILLILVFVIYMIVGKISQSMMQSNPMSQNTPEAERIQNVSKNMVWITPIMLTFLTYTSIAANELGVGFKLTSGPVLDKPGDLAGLLTSLEPHDVLFIDEIHRLQPVVEEYLYSAMEDYRIDIMIDRGPAARSIQLDLNPFTLIGATTRSGLLTAPLRARFGINLHLEYYDALTIGSILARSAGILGVPLKDEARKEIAGRSRGTPRIANALLRRVRDFAQVKGTGTIDPEIANFALEALNIDRYGLDDTDNKILLTIIDKFKGGPVGIGTIATAIGEDPGTLEEVYEPFLIKEGFIRRTPRGREVTELAFKHLNRPLPRTQPEQPSLF